MIRTTPIPLTPVLLAIAAALAATAHGADAQAAGLHEGVSRDPSKIVTYTKMDVSDIDVRSTSGAQALLQRIDTAAAAVCGGAPASASQAARADFEDCRDAAISGAVAKMRSPALTALASRRRRDLLAAR